MNFEAHPIEPFTDALLVMGRMFRDARGWFQATWNQDALANIGLDAKFLQDNLAFSNQRFTLRGLHFQTGSAAQGKLVRCVAGSLLDVIVDIRPTSPSFGRTASIQLDGGDARMVWVPRGFAHGYCTLVPETLASYKVDAPFTPTAERIIRWDDPDLAIAWPTVAPILSPRDATAPLLREALQA